MMDVAKVDRQHFTTTASHTSKKETQTHQTDERHLELHENRKHGSWQIVLELS